MVQEESLNQGQEVTGEGKFLSGSSLKVDDAAPEEDSIHVGSAQGSPDPDVLPKTPAHKSCKNNVPPLLLILAAVVVIIAVNVIIVLMPTDEKRWQEQYDLGQQYLLELDYEQAIVAFTAAIEIDANHAEAYVARAGAYLAADASDVSEINVSNVGADGEKAFVLSDCQSAALADYLTAIELDDTLVDAYVGAAELYVVAGEYDLAIELLSSYPADEEDSVPGQIADMLEELSIQSGKESLCIKYSGEGYYYLYEYDAYGNCLRENYYQDDALLEYSVYFYDESGNLVLWISYDPDEKMDRWCVHIYDSEENLMTGFSAYYADGTAYAHSEYGYDSDGNLTTSLVYNESGTSRTEYVYTDGNLTASYSYDETGELDSYTIYETDDAGNESSYIFYYADGTIWYTVEFEYVYDEEGFLLRSVRKDSYEYSSGAFSAYYVGEYTVVELLPWDETAVEEGRAAGYVLTGEEITAVINGEWLPDIACEQ